MDISPHDAEYQTKINQMILNFAVKEKPEFSGKPSSELRAESRPQTTSDGAKPQETSAVKDKLQSAMEARAYMDEHNLFKYVQEMVKYLISEKPADPYGSMINYLHRHKQMEKTPSPPAQPKPEVQRPQIGKEQARPLAAASTAAAEEELRSQVALCLITALNSGHLEKALPPPGAAEATPVAPAALDAAKATPLAAPVAPTAGQNDATVKEIIKDMPSTALEGGMPQQVLHKVLIEEKMQAKTNAVNRQIQQKLDDALESGILAKSIEEVVRAAT